MRPASTGAEILATIPSVMNELFDRIHGASVRGVIVALQEPWLPSA